MPIMHLRTYLSNAEKKDDFLIYPLLFQKEVEYVKEISIAIGESYLKFNLSHEVRRSVLSRDVWANAN